MDQTENLILERLEGLPTQQNHPECASICLNFFTHWKILVWSCIEKKTCYNAAITLGDAKMLKVLHAVEVATRAHGMTQRKYPAEKGRPMPYILHPIRVMRRVETYVTEWSGGKDFANILETMLAVAALHDTVEDTELTLRDIEHSFGTEVCYGVQWLTNPSKDHPQLTRELRKAMDREHIHCAPRQWQIVKLWDRIDNIYDMVPAPPDFIRLYCEESRLLTQAIGGSDPDVAKQLLEAIDWLLAINRGRQ